MNSRHKWAKILWVIPLLLVTTLLFLEIPKIYYHYLDQQLLKESGYSEYESQDTKNKAAFLERAEEFLSYSSTSEPVYMEHSLELADEELYETVLELVQELNLLLGGNYKSVLEEMLIGYKETRGFTTRYVFGDNYLDVGFLEFFLPAIDVNGTILYDVDSYKIFWVEWWYTSEDDENVKKLEESSVLEYYDDIVSSEITLIEESEYILITPFPTEVINNKLLDELYEFQDRYWGVSEIESE